jgi:2,3-bisphosphoglycerate-independent phosphoglycerate mutase
MRCILLLLDGLGDRGHRVFDGLTPLQAAHTPNLDAIARAGMTGLYHAHLQGTALPSELAHFIMFGYDLAEFPGRGLIEAIGDGIAVAEGEVALLSRIFGVAARDGHLVLEHEDPKIDAALCRELQEHVRHFEHGGVTVEFVPGKGIGGILLLRGDVSAAVTDSNPIIEGRPLMEVLPIAGHEGDAAAVRTADVLNEYLRWSHGRLQDHPLNRQRLQAGTFAMNGVGTQRAGKRRPLVPFAESWGLRGLMIASGSIYHGLGEVIGMDTLRVRDTGDPEKDMVERLRLAKEATDYDFIHLHTKVPDEAGHRRDPLYKKQVIEALDRAVAYALEEILPDEEVLFVVTADHSTAACGSMIHTGETVPLAMAGRYTRRDTVAAFDEIACAAGALGPVRGRELMYLILNFLDRGKLWGLMDSPVDQPYTPGRYTPLRLAGHGSSGRTSEK